jgi:ribosomal 50S subunit-associated protein YjgA (DUF615 family)
VTVHPVLPPAADIVAEMEQAVTGQPRTAETALKTAIADLVESNLRQWDLEDATRDPGASDAQVANAKREIDRLNVSRHRLVEEIDVAIDSVLDQPATARLATESPGMVLDRLSVLVIRRIRTAVASRRDPKFAGRARALEAQVGALSAALDSYVDELGAGTRRFLRYQSLKLYDPSTTAAGSAKE